MENEVSNLEYFKALTPFILAIFVYLVWHFQKSNEVLASESKNLITQINDLMQINNDLMYSLRNNFSVNFVNEETISGLKSKLSEFDLKINLFFGTFNFLIEAIGENKLTLIWLDWAYGFKRAHKNYCMIMSKIESKHNFLEEDENSLVDIHNFLVMDCNKLKRVFLDYAMYRNTWVFRVYVNSFKTISSLKKVLKVK